MKTRTLLLLIALLCLALVLLASGSSYIRETWAQTPKLDGSSASGAVTANATATAEAAAKVQDTATKESGAGAAGPATPGSQIGMPIASAGQGPGEPPFSPAVWAAMPECANQPEMHDQFSQKGEDTAVSRQAARIAPGMAAQGLLAQEGSTELNALALNVATGRLNRATEIQVAAVPEARTVGDLLDRAQAAQGQISEDLVEAARQVESGAAITRPVCARLVVTNAENQPQQVDWAGGGMNAASLIPQQAAAAPGSAPTKLPVVMDTGSASPNGQWAAFTSLGWDAGGPIFLQNLVTAESVNLIERMNSTVTEGQLPEDAWWEVIGWFPDSQRILIGPSDASSVYIVSIADGAFQSIGLPTGGEGGGRVVVLAPDGTSLAYISLEGGTQVLTLTDLASGESRALLSVPLSDGILHYPRFSPDGRSLAYVQQLGHPLTGVTEAIWLVSTETAATTLLIDGGLGLSVPTWSPDGAFLAFTRKDNDKPDVAVEGYAPQPARSNVWVASVPDGKLWQVTRLDGQARSPAWSSDSATLGFVTHDGQVGMVNIHRPGQAWLAAETSRELPLYTTVFFVP